MFRRHKRRHTNILFVIFRLLLSLVIFTTLLAGIFSAYKHFSGTNPLNLDPKAVGTMIQEIKDKIFQKTPEQKIVPASEPKLVFRFALFADSHSDNIFLKKTLEQIKKNYPEVKFIIGLGDYTEVGTLDELKKAKLELDNAGLRYFLTPGDHDLWESRNKSLPPNTNYKQIFGPSYQSFISGNFLFILLYNSDNYIGLGDDQKSWLSNELGSNKDIAGTFIFLHEPLFHPSSDHFMGRIEQKIKIQAQDLTNQFAKASVKKVFAGDTHFFSEYEEPSTKLPMATVGAITSQRNLQLPRFAIVSIYEDGSTGVEDVEVK